MAHSKEQIETLLKSILENQTGIPERDIGGGSRMGEDLGADSLDLVEISMDIEDEFDIELLDEDLDKKTTLSKLMETVAEKQK